MALTSLNVIVLITCAFAVCVNSVLETKSHVQKEKSVREAIERRSDGLERQLVNILVDEKQERENLRNDNRLMKKKLEDVLRELGERNKILGDKKFQRKKLIEEVKNTKTELKAELEKELKKQLLNFNDTLISLKTDSEKMGAKIEDLKIVWKGAVAIKGKVKALEEASSKHGAVYIRWGRNRCPLNTTDLIYSGRLGGTIHNAKAGPSNYQCLPDDPDWRNPKSGQQGSLIYGGEYDNLNHYSAGDLLDKKHYQYDVVCAVCQSRIRKVMYMMPGKSHCPKRWHMEYRGYLMSGHYSHAASNYICVDSNPDVIPGTNSNDNAVILLTVEAACKSMKCPPYVSGYELTCAVCTK